MTELLATIRLESDRAAYRPGEILAGFYRLDAATQRDVESVELSVMWYSEGRGDEDLVVIYFERLSNEDGELDLSTPRRFSTPLPNSPLSYDGVIVKIFWCVRVRLFVRNGKQVCFEQPFQLGTVPPAEPVEAP